MKAYTITTNDMQAGSNDVITLFARRLQRDGVIEDADKILSRYAVIVFEKGMLGRFLDKLLGLDDDGISYRIVRID